MIPLGGRWILKKAHGFILLLRVDAIIPLLSPSGYPLLCTVLKAGACISGTW